jgi:hypothetical protein
MKLIRQTFSCDASSHDASMIRDHLVVGVWAIESGCNPVSAHQPSRMSVWRHSTAGMAISVRNGTALRLALGPALVEWLDRQGQHLGPLAGLALHELVVNAAVHGNLAINSGQLDVRQDLAARQAVIAASDADPQYRDRLVTIAVCWNATWLAAIVSDEGSGYDTEAPAQSGRASGRGLGIIRAAGRMESFNGGRQAVLTLDRGSAETGA